ncbi:MAG: hypothetical protein R3B84_09900 [Zavarzinella sp.]
MHTERATPETRPLSMWFIALLVPLAVQAWLSLQLFGNSITLSQLSDSRPIINGLHPENSYHAFQGYRTWHESQTISNYDPTLQAGYTRTPLLSGSSRPAQLLLHLLGPVPASYKWGIFFLCMVAPLLAALTARLAGIHPAGAILCSCLSIVAWWAPTNQHLLKHGSLDILLFCMALPLYLAAIANFSRNPTFLVWLAASVGAIVCWFAMPLGMIFLIPLQLFLHIWLFHPWKLHWQVALLAVYGCGIAANAVWLHDWCLYNVTTLMDLNSTTTTDEKLLIFRKYIPGNNFERIFTLLGGAGWVVMHRRHAGFAWIILTSLLLLVGMHFVTAFFPALATQTNNVSRSVVQASFVVMGGYFLAWLLGGMDITAGITTVGTFTVAGVLFIAGYGFHVLPPTEVKPFQIGLDTGREQIVKTLREASTNEGRILWEDRTDLASHTTWAVLLPEYTQRQMIGGLNSSGCQRVFPMRLVDGKLAGTDIADWKDEELDAYFRRYNITRVVAWNAYTIERLNKYPNAIPAAGFHESGDGTLFVLNRQPDFFLAGSGKVVSADARKIVLTDLVPNEHGVIILSYHYDARLTVIPEYLTVERDLDVRDPTGMIRMKLADPIRRIVIQFK